jgi:hypothetical protein
MAARQVMPVDDSDVCIGLGQQLVCEAHASGTAADDQIVGRQHCYPPHLSPDTSWLPAQGTMLSTGVRPQSPAQYLRGSSRRCPGAGQDGGVQAIIPRQETCRNAVCALEAYLAARPVTIARAMRCPVRVHVGSDCAEPPQACQVGRQATTVRPCVRCVTVARSVKSSVSRRTIQRAATDGFKASAVPRSRHADFCNKICHEQTFRHQLIR